jgi:transcriptional regulator with PAS, ATPase and Fis domain
MSPLDARAMVAKVCGWSAWDQEKAQRIEREALKDAPRGSTSDLAKELTTAGITFQAWKDPRLPALNCPITEVSVAGRSAIIGSSARTKALWIAVRTGRLGWGLLIEGDTGSGKELVAHSYHEASRKRGPFVSVNCAEIPEGIAEAELFGAVRNAGSSFAGRTGLFELADHGTIFLDEIGELPLEVQAKVLRVVQEGTLRKTGESVDRQIDVRVVAATNRDLLSEISAGRFRADLYYRLNQVSVLLPPLVDCGEEILAIAHVLLDQCSCSIDQRRGRSFTPEALARILEYHWPGNIRELQNAIKRALGFGANPIPADHLLPPFAIPSSSRTRIDRGRFTSEQFEAILRMNAEGRRKAQIFVELKRSYGFQRNKQTFYRYMSELSRLSQEFSGRLVRSR